MSHTETVLRSYRIDVSGISLRELDELALGPAVEAEVRDALDPHQGGSTAAGFDSFMPTGTSS